MTIRNLIPCPESYTEQHCPTMLQRDMQGDLIEGVRLHLLTVHNYQGPRAAAVARRWVREQA